MVFGSGEELLKRMDTVENSIMSVSERGYMTSPHGHVGDALGKRKATAHVEGMASSIHTWTHTHGHTHTHTTHRCILVLFPKLPEDQTARWDSFCVTM